MKVFVVLAALVTACATVPPGTVGEARTPVPSPADGAEHAVKQVAVEMGDAMVANDVGRLDRIYAEEFVSIGFSGRMTTKPGLMDLYRSAQDKLLSFQLGPTDVHVSGRLAVSQGSVQEHRVRDDKDVSGVFAWMDLLEQREGRWVVVRSAGARITGTGSALSPLREPASVAAIENVERGAGSAMLAADVDALRALYADDWMMVPPDGSVYDKARLIGEVRGRRLLAYAPGQMKVQVLGDVAMAQMGVTARWVEAGAEKSGEFVYMDLLSRRTGAWQIVRTLSARVR